MDSSGLFMLIGSLVIVTVLLVSNSKKRYGARPPKKNPGETPSDYARKKHPPPET